ncbi:MAG: methyltransferase domain-containing protein [Coprobacillus sp.]|nr:methyltransferase domain-containing protein [Coprobacillus sp.]
MLKNNMICPKCHSNLIYTNKTYKCVNNHSYDISKEGYINLLLSKTNCGDLDDSVHARREFLNKGFYDPLSNLIKDLLIKVNARKVLDCGCGVGYYSQMLSHDFEITGIDISKNAIKLASKKDNISSYIVSSSKFIPIQKNYFDAAYVIFAPLFEESMANVLNANGYLIVVSPNTNHLFEIKEKLYQNPYLNEKVELDIKSFAHIDSLHLTYKVEMNNCDIKNLIAMTPYFYKTKKEDLEKINTIDFLNVTIDFQIDIFQKLEF